MGQTNGLRKFNPDAFSFLMTSADAEAFTQAMDRTNGFQLG
jgi:hypothetical protein